MTLFQASWANFVFQTLFAEFIVTIAGVLVARTIVKAWVNWRYGRWTVTVIKDGEKKLDRIKITPAKMRQVKQVEEDMPVFLKGLCSPFHHIRCDLTREGVALGVLQEDEQARHIRINLDKDPQDDGPEASRAAGTEPGLHTQ